MKETVEGARAYRYDPAQRAFHWAMAVVVLAAICIGLYAAQLEPGTHPRVELLDVHKSLGMAALVLLPFRFVWRLIAGEPAWRVPPSRLVRAASHGAHFLLYLLMAVMPVTGYLQSAAGGHSLPFFGLFSWPLLVSKDKALNAAAAGVHHWAGWTITALVCVHICAVVWHRLRRDETLGRMAPRLSGSA